MINQSTFEKLNAIPASKWGEIYKRLVFYAANRLRLSGFEGRKENDIINAEDIAGIAIERVFDGTRAWDFERFPDIEIHLKGIVKSIISSHLKSSSRMPFVQQLVEEKEPDDPNATDTSTQYFYDDESETLCIKEAHWAFIEEHFIEDDDGLIIFYDWIEGLPPREISSQYGIEIKHVYNVIKKCRRVIVSLSKVFNNV